METQATPPARHGSRGIRGDIQNMRDTMAAFWHDLLTGRSMRIFIVLGALALGVLILRGATLDRIMLVWAFIVVTLVAEAANTALEELCELMWPRLPGESNAGAATRQPGVARLKHIAAAVVFVAGALGAVPAFGLVLFLPG